MTSKNYFDLYFSKTALKKNLENHNYLPKILLNYLVQFWRVLNIFKHLLNKLFIKGFGGIFIKTKFFKVVLGIFILANFGIAEYVKTFEIFNEWSSYFHDKNNVYYKNKLYKVPLNVDTKPFKYSTAPIIQQTWQLLMLMVTCRIKMEFIILTWIN